jgi:hypothetical protein
MSSSCLVRLFILHAFLIAASEARPQQPFDLDTTFRTAIDTWYVSSVAPLPDGDVLLSGQIRFPGDPIGTFRLLARVDQSGNRIPWFPYAYGGGNLKEWNGRYYVLNNQIVRRIWPDGTTDTDFIGMNFGPYFSSLQGGDYHVYPDGRILMGGVHELRDSIRGFEDLYCLIWFSNTGYLDTTKTHRTCAGSLDFFQELPNGQFIGSLGNPPNTASWEGEPTGSNVIRFNDDGEWDQTFQADVWWGTAYCFLPLPDGRVYAGGSFRISSLPNDTLHLVRFMPDGSLDPTFYNTARYRAPSMNNMQWDGGLVRSIMALADGRLVVTGQFDHVDGNTRGCIALVDSNGTLLDDYFTGSGAGNFTYQGVTASSLRITPAPDGSYYLTGAYHGYDDGTTNDTLQRMVSRLHGLNVGVQERPVSTLAVQAHPNPAQDNITFSWPVQRTAGHLQVRDLCGRSLIEVSLPAGSDNRQVSLAGLAPGVYPCVLRWGAIQTTVRVVVKP